MYQYINISILGPVFGILALVFYVLIKPTVEEENLTQEKKKVIDDNFEKPKILDGDEPLSINEDSQVFDVITQGNQTSR